MTEFSKDTSGIAAEGKDVLFVYQGEVVMRLEDESPAGQIILHMLTAEIELKQDVRTATKDVILANGRLAIARAIVKECHRDAVTLLRTGTMDDSATILLKHIIRRLAVGMGEKKAWLEEKPGEVAN